MVFPFLSHLRNLWPFKFDDLRTSNDLVRKLTIPESTRQFVFAVRDQESQAIVYLLAAQNLSEQSAVDAETLIREVRPDAVVAHVSPSSAAYVQSEYTQLDSSDYVVPTSFFQVLRRCFRDKFTKEKYEHVAGSLVMREIFGTSFLGHFSAAKIAAGDIGAPFLWLQSPFLTCFDDLRSDEHTKRNNFMHLGFQLTNYESQKMCFSTPSDSKGLIHTHGDHLHTIRSLCSYLELSISSLDSSSPVSNLESKDILPQINYEAPPFAQPIYPLLLDLRNIFDDIPSIGKALYHAQKLLSDVSSGEKVDIKIIREVYAFRIAVEGLRMVLNNAARLPTNKFKHSSSTEASFSDLSDEHKSHALLAQALRAETKNFKTIVAIVDANILAGIRRQWNTPVPKEVKDMAGSLVTTPPVNFNEQQLSHIMDEKQLIKNQVVAVGAGATAALGVSSISKLIPSSTVMKFVTFKLPVPFKIVLIHSKKALGVAFGKFSGSSAALSYGSKTTSALRTAAMAEKMRVAAHSIIAYAERTSLSAMRASFYEVMRKRQAHAPGLFPLFAFGCSFSACAGLVVYREGIECVAESLVDAPSIASLGRGIQNLHKASLSAKQSQGERLHRSLELLMLKLKKVKIQ